MPIPHIIDIITLGAGTNKTAAENDAAFSSAFNTLNEYLTGSKPSQYIEGGGIIRVPSGKYEISQPIKLSHAMRLDGDSIESTIIFTNTTGIDLVHICHEQPITTLYTTNHVGISNLTLDGNGEAKSGFTNRDDQPIANCQFNHLHLRGFKETGFHIFSGWNNAFYDITIRDALFGFIGEVSKTPLVENEEVFNQGFNNNSFIKVVVNWVSRCGGLIWGVHDNSTTLGAKCVSNEFLSCNFEAIKLESSKSLSPYTDTNSNQSHIKYDGKAIGLWLAGSCQATKISGCYFEAIGELNGADDGYGVLLDSRGLSWGNTLPYLESSSIKDNYFNSNMGPAIWVASALYTVIDSNKLHNVKIKIDSDSKGNHVSNHIAQEIDSSGNGDFTRAGTTHENVRDLAGDFQHYGFQLGLSKHKVEGNWTRIGQVDTQFNTVENYRFQSRWANVGGIRALRFDAMYSSSSSYSETDGEYMSVHVSPDGSNSNNNGIAHATIGLPKNTGEFQISANATGFVEVVNNYMQDGDAVSVNIKGTANGISNLWVEKTEWNKIKVHFNGSSASVVTCSYLFIHPS